MARIDTQIPTETWIAMAWEEYTSIIDDPIYEKSKGYYYRGNGRIEMLPVSFEHGKDHAMIMVAIGALRGSPSMPH